MYYSFPKIFLLIEYIPKHHGVTEINDIRWRDERVLILAVCECDTLQLRLLPVELCVHFDNAIPVAPSGIDLRLGFREKFYLELSLR